MNNITEPVIEILCVNIVMLSIKNLLSKTYVIYPKLINILFTYLKYLFSANL